MKRKNPTTSREWITADFNLSSTTDHPQKVIRLKYNASKFIYNNNRCIKTRSVLIISLLKTNKSQNYQPEMQFNLDCSCATGVLWWLKDATEDIWGACSIFLSSITSVKGHHGMRDQIYRLCSVWRAFKKQLGFLKIEPGRIKSKTTHRRDLQFIYSLESFILQVWHTAEIFHLGIF